MAKCELRTISGVQLRAAKGADFVLEGIAASYNMPSKPIPGGPAGMPFIEKIKRGAFARALHEKQDVKALFNHNPNYVLGRVKNGTLQLSDTDTGLAFRVQLNDKSQTHRDIYANVRSGLVDECSFAFVAKGEKWNAGYTQRALTDVDLLDVSIVTDPAYGGSATIVQARSAQYVVTQDWRSKHMAALAKLAPIVAADKAAIEEDEKWDRTMRQQRAWLED
jgi:uncharacterized protein